MNNKTTKPLFAAIALSVGLLYATTANANLVSALGGQVVNDTDLNITWLANANLANTQNFGIISSYPNGSMEWGAAVLWIAAMNTANYLGYNDWRLPTSDICSGYSCTNSEMGHLFYTELGQTAGGSILSSANADLALFSNVQSHSYWSGTESLRTNQIFSALPSDGVSASKTIIKKISPVFV